MPASIDWGQVLFGPSVYPCVELFVCPQRPMQKQKNHPYIHPYVLYISIIVLSFIECIINQLTFLHRSSTVIFYYLNEFSWWNDYTKWPHIWQEMVISWYETTNSMVRNDWYEMSIIRFWEVFKRKSLQTHTCTGCLCINRIIKEIGITKFNWWKFQCIMHFSYEEAPKSSNLPWLLKCFTQK